MKWFPVIIALGIRLLTHDFFGKILYIQDMREIVWKICERRAVYGSLLKMAYIIDLGMMVGKKAEIECKIKSPELFSFILIRIKYF